MSRKIHMRSHQTQPLGLSNIKAYPKVRSEINNVRTFAPNGISGPGTLSGNYPFFNHLTKRSKRH